MSSRSKRDLIERVRYPNPLPLPPYPPKLVDIPTPPSTYSNPIFGDRIARAHPLPVIADGLAGMPLDLTSIPGLWESTATGAGDESVAPSTEPKLDTAILDEEDAFLLSDFTAGPAASLPLTNGHLANASQSHGAGRSGTPTVAVQARDVTWLRRTEYLSNEIAQQKRAAEGNALKPTAEIDTSVSGHVERIEATFAAARRPLSTLQHPTKRHLHAVEAYDVLPDVETWATEYQILRYADWPGRTRNAQPVSDPRLSTALLRPVVDELGASRLSMYLPTGETREMLEGAAEEAAEGEAASEKDDLTRRLEGLGKVEREDEMARLAMDRRRAGWLPNKVTREVEQEEGDEGAVEIEEVYEDKHAPAFRFVRDYELSDQVTDVANHLVLVLDDGSPEGSSSLAPAPAEVDADHPRARTLPPQSAEERALRVDAARKEGASAAGPEFAEPPRHAAYYHPIKMRTTLRMRRLRRSEARGGQYESFWDGLTISHRPLSEREALKRRHARSSIDDLGELEELLLSEAELDEEEEEMVGEGDGAGGRARYDVDGAMEGVVREVQEREEAGLESEDDDEDALRTQRRAKARTAPSAAESQEEQEGRGASPDSVQDRDLASGPDENEGSASGSDSDEEDGDAEVEGDEELAALQAEAQDAGVEADTGEGGRGSRRRRTEGGDGAEKADADAMDVDKEGGGEVEE